MMSEERAGSDRALGEHPESPVEPDGGFARSDGRPTAPSHGSDVPGSALEQLLAEADWVDPDESVWAPVNAEAMREAIGWAPGGRPSQQSDPAPAPLSEPPLPRTTGRAANAPAPVAPESFESLVSEATQEPAPRRAFLALPRISGPGGKWGLAAAVGVVVLGLGLVGGAAVALQEYGEAQQTAAQEHAPRQSDVIPPRPAVEPAADHDQQDDGSEGIADLVDTSWADPLAAEAGIPHRAMRAYAGAAIRLAEEYPGCGLGWNTLAGIGQVESEHGTIDGGEIAPNGRATPPIVGIPLDGTSTDRIHDTDGGDLDGDATWDRAVGPMQFIPSTWADWAADGNGDGIKDPQNIDDAALGAARYLCDVGGDLSQPDNWIAAVAAYNDTVEYNNRVADAADHYASFG